jgi:hypothetical protein
MDTNPFDDDESSYYGWPITRSSTACGPPLPMFQPGWRVVYGEADPAACLDYIEQNWTDIQPKSLARRGQRVRYSLRLGRGDFGEVVWSLMTGHCR